MVAGVVNMITTVLMITIIIAPRGATPVNWTSATDWQMAVGRDNVIIIIIIIIII